MAHTLDTKMQKLLKSVAACLTPASTTPSVLHRSEPPADRKAFLDQFSAKVGLHSEYYSRTIFQTDDAMGPQGGLGLAWSGADIKEAECGDTFRMVLPGV